MSRSSCVFPSGYLSPRIVLALRYAPTENGVDIGWLSAYTEGARYYVSDVITVNAGRWTTFSVSVAEMNAQLGSNRYNFANTTSLVFRWLEHTGVPRVIYLDNFRMEY